MTTYRGKVRAVVASLKNNIAALYGVQLANYAIPLLTLPCLTRALQPDGFGRFSFCIAFNAYFVMLVDYGFNFSATQEVARHRDDKAARSKIFWSTLAVKTLLAVLGIALLLGATYLFRALEEDRILLLTGYLAVIGSVLTPAWYFQGTEDLALLSAISVSFRLASVPLTYLLVRNTGDLVTAIAIAAAPSIGAGVTCLGVLAFRSALQWQRISQRDLSSTLFDGWHLFLSTAAISLYSTTNVILLNFAAGNTAVGYFSAAEKIAKAGAGLMSPVSAAVYPRISRLIDESREEAFALIRRLLHVQAAIGLTISLSLLLLAPYVIRLLYGAAFAEATAVLRWLSALPFLLAVSNVLGVQTMLPLRMKRSVMSILVLAGAVNVLLLYALASLFGANGAAASVLAAETLVSGLMFYVLWSRQVPVLGFT